MELLPALLPVLALLPILALSIASLICFILVLVEMFKRDETALGVICIVLSVVTGVGTLIAFVYGWMKSSEWGLKKVMITWTACVAGMVVLVALYFATAGFFLLQVPAEHAPPPVVEQAE